MNVKLGDQMPLLLNPNTTFSSLLVTPFSHALEDRTIASLLVGDGRACLYNVLVSFYGWTNFYWVNGNILSSWIWYDVEFLQKVFFGKDVAVRRIWSEWAIYMEIRQNFRCMILWRHQQRAGISFYFLFLTGLRRYKHTIVIWLGTLCHCGGI